MIKLGNRNTAITYHDEETFHYRRKSSRELISHVASACDIRDQKIMGHLSRVQELTKMLIKAYNRNREVLNKDYYNSIADSSILHDIGKARIPVEILYKTGELDHSERNMMNMHPIIGAAMFKEKTFRVLYCDNLVLKVAENIILYHHERWDGTGYPYNLKGYEIPLEARIVAIADSYDALTNERSYKKAWSKEKTLQYIYEQKGKQFDPDITEVFLEVI